MANNRCLICNGTNFRADRALAGRLVCNQCGTPIGIRANYSKINNNKNFRINRFGIYLIIGLIAFLILITI